MYREQHQQGLRLQEGGFGVQTLNPPFCRPIPWLRIIYIMLSSEIQAYKPSMLRHAACSHPCLCHRLGSPHQYEPLPSQLGALP